MAQINQEMSKQQFSILFQRTIPWEFSMSSAKEHTM